MEAQARPEPTSFAEWQVELEAAFLVRRGVDESLIFFLDDDEAAQLWPYWDEPARELARSVYNRLDWQAPTAVFGSLEEEFRRWERSSRTSPPPVLPVLLITVLAAAEMHRDGIASASAYFIRLAQVLLPDATRDAQTQAKQRLDDNFGIVATWWKELKGWLDHHPDYGRNTISEHPTLTRIGYPISQALLKRSDRSRLTHFYSAIDLPTESVPDASVLCKLIEIWATPARNLSRAFHAGLSDPARRPLLALHVHRLAVTWDGIVLTPEGMHELDIRLALDLDDFRARWVIKCWREAPEIDIQIGEAWYHLAPHDSGAFFDAEPELPALTVPPNGLLSLRASGPGFAGSFAMPEVQAFREHPDAGWLSEHGMVPFEPHLLAVAPDRYTEVHSLLGAAADPGWAPIRQSPQRYLLRGRMLIRGVLFSSRNKFEASAAQLDPELAALLRPVPGARPRLSDGLQVLQHLAGRHYLTGGEPDLNLPVGDRARITDTKLDGETQLPPFVATGFPIELRRLGPLSPGRHVVDADGVLLEFFLHASDEPEFGTVTSTDQAAEESANGDRVVRKSATVAAPRLLRRSRAVFWTCRADGELHRETPPVVNLFLSHVGLFTQLWEFVPQREQVWLIECDRDRYAAHLLHWRSPSFGILDLESQEVWSALANQTGADPLLEIYAKAWRGRRGNG